MRRRTEVALMSGLVAGNLIFAVRADDGTPWSFIIHVIAAAGVGRIAWLFYGDRR